MDMTLADGLAAWRRRKHPARLVGRRVIFGIWASVVCCGAVHSTDCQPACEAARTSCNRAAITDTGDWSHTLARIADSVIAIHVDLARSFDTEINASLQATGFVIDAQRGLVLTNRHVVTPGPVTAEAVFQDREEVQLKPVYRDPVHDFGFYRYDPSMLRFLKPHAIVLDPAAAHVGTEIRVAGNDAGEQLSFLSGTLARLDRQAPSYGIGKYNDFNTFYYEAASNTSGGSSGSPVIDLCGRAVALNAGAASGAASSFYLPLNRVVRALQYIEANRPVPRGTLQTVFRFTPFDELRRLGLPESTETTYRAAFPKQLGMLVVAEVQPGSAAASTLEVGDILLRLDGRWAMDFLALEDMLDDSVGRSLSIEVQRQHRLVKVELRVDDLHAITPAEYLDIGDAVIHELSYQQARHLNVPIRGAYVANPGYMLSAAGIYRGAVIRQFGGRDIATLDDLEQALAVRADGERVMLRYFTAEEPDVLKVQSVKVDRRWYPAQRCRRDDGLGTWICRALPPPPPAVPPAPVETRVIPELADPRLRHLGASLVGVHFTVPYPVSGITGRVFDGTGLIVDAERGLVVVDRDTVPVAEGDVQITAAGKIELPGTVRFVHPLNNLALVAYDPRLVGATPLRAARRASREIRPGERVWVIGLRPDQRLMAQESRVAAVEPVDLPIPRTPSFRETNTDVITLVDGPRGYDGVIVGESGEVIGLWSTFVKDDGHDVTEEHLGVPIEPVEEMVQRVVSGGPLRSLEAELKELPLSQAIELGLGEPWLNRLDARSSRGVLAVERLVTGSPAARVLQPGDLLLAVDGKVVGGFRDVERAVQTRPQVELSLWRDGALHTARVDTVEYDGRDVDRLVQWAGATLQAPHRALAAQYDIPLQGVFVAYYLYGSPASRYGLAPPRRIVEVDGNPTPDLDAFLAAVSGKHDRDAVLLKTVARNNAVEVITLKLDTHYWPTYEVRRDADGWERRSVPVR